MRYFLYPIFAVTHTALGYIRIIIRRTKSLMKQSYCSPDYGNVSAASSPSFGLQPTNVKHYFLAIRFSTSHCVLFKNLRAYHHGSSPCLFTARCTLVQRAVLRSHARLSVCLSVTLVNCDHIGWNSSKIISPLVSLGCSLFAAPT